MAARDFPVIASFLFLPNYMRLEGRPVIHLLGADEALVHRQAEELSVYLAAQGYSELSMVILSPGEVLDRPESITRQYKDLLRNRGVSGPVYFSIPADELEELLSSLKEVEGELEQEAPGLLSSIHSYRRLEEEVHFLRQLLGATETELQHQQQYLELLRSGHQAREIQEYYNREYEILPLWFKRLGHIVKVLSGKRHFGSLFRDDVKKYKD
jgi:hypothetical protein